MSRVGGRSSREGSNMFAGSRARGRNRVEFPGLRDVTFVRGGSTVGIGNAAANVDPLAKLYRIDLFSIGLCLLLGILTY